MQKKLFSHNGIKNQFGYFWLVFQLWQLPVTVEESGEMQAELSKVRG